jgi:hypothetical protein
MDSKGKAYENCVQLLVGRIASLVRVPREEDFGIDFYCHPLLTAGPTTETVKNLAGLQVKGGTASLTYGGTNDRDAWREYEFAWLRALAIPLYLAHVNMDCNSVELFGTWPLWWLFWRHSEPPYEVVLKTEPFGTATGWHDPTATPHPNGLGKGDSMRWTVNLGPPFLRLTNENTNDQGFREMAVAILTTWITRDRLSLMRSHQFVPVLTGITQWTTNALDGLVATDTYFWDARPGVNILQICQASAPVIVNLGVHLQWQGNKDAYRLLPILEWAGRPRSIGRSRKRTPEEPPRDTSHRNAPSTNWVPLGHIIGVYCQFVPHAWTIATSLRSRSHNAFMHASYYTSLSAGQSICEPARHTPATGP